jgi:hypothetical protein
VTQNLPARQNRPGELIIEDAHILGGQFKNFSGEERMYNAPGDRNFNLRLPEDLAQQMINDGWNVKFKDPRNEEEDGFFYLKVTVGFKGKRPPILVLITSKGRVDLSQHECDVLDWVDIEKADVIVNPSFWDVNGKVGIKAYLKALYVTIREDYLSQKYADVPYADGSEAMGIGGGERLAIGTGGDAPDEEDGVVDAEVIYDSDEEV